MLEWYASVNCDQSMPSVFFSFTCCTRWHSRRLEQVSLHLPLWVLFRLFISTRVLYNSQYIRSSQYAKISSPICVLNKHGLRVLLQGLKRTILIPNVNVLQLSPSPIQIFTKPTSFLALTVINTKTAEDADIRYVTATISNICRRY